MSQYSNRHLFKLFHFILLLFCCANLARSQNTLQSYFQLVKSMEYDKAEQLIEDNEKQEYSLILKKISRLLIDNGQKIHHDSTFLTQQISVQKDGLDRGLALMAKGFEEIVYNKAGVHTLVWFQEALEIARELGDNNLEKQIYIGILRLYRQDIIQVGKATEHMRYLDEFESILEDHIDSVYYALNNFTYQSKTDGPIDDAFLDSYKLLKDLFKGIESESKLNPLFTFEKGIYLKIIGSLDEAELAYKELLAETPLTPVYRYQIFGAYLMLSELASIDRDSDMALFYLNKTQEYTDRSLPTLSRYYYYKYGSRVFERQEEVLQALRFLKKADSLQIELFKIGDVHNRSAAFVRYETRKTERNLSLERERKERTRVIALILAFVLIGVFVISFFLFRDAKRKRLIMLKEKDFEREKVDNLLRKQELISIESMLEGQEKERKRVAEELHDRLGSTLSAAKMHLEVMQEGNEGLSNISRILDKAVTDTREIAHNMLSGVLTKFGLLAALDDLKKTIVSTNSIGLKITNRQLDERLPTDVEINVYRVIQELVSNSLKHASASQMTVLITKSENQLTVLYKDDGQGFDPHKERTGMGLKNIDARIQKIGGSWHMHSEPRAGLEVEIEIKL